MISKSPSFNGQETLRTTRLTLVPLTPKHRDFLFELDSDPAVMKYIGYGKPLSASDSALGLKCLLELAVCGLGCWAGYAGSDFVGWWVLAAGETKDTPPQVDMENVIFGLKLSPKFWGRGYAKEGSCELFRHAFQDLGVQEVSADAMAINTGSRATMAACGMRYIRTFHNEYPTPPPGIEEGEVEYRITKDEWLLKGDGRD